MLYEDLTDDQKDVVKEMVSFCLNNCIGLGMDEGYKDNGEPDETREALTNFVTN